MSEAGMISFGAGLNSTAMVIMMVDQGWRGPIVFSDTGGERPETYCYMRYFEDQYLRPRGLEVLTLRPETHAELYDVKRLGYLAPTLEAYCVKAGIIPLLSVRWCSVQWKRNPMEAWRKSQGIAVTALGICASEPRRIRDDPGVEYPLYEEGVTRGECRRIILGAGLEAPIKSGCFFCPGQRYSQWKRLFFDFPELYARAVDMEENANKRNPKRKKAPWTLDPHGITLRDHARKRAWEGQGEMDFSDTLPCICSL